MTLEPVKPENITPQTKAEYAEAMRDYYAAGISENNGGSPRENANDAYATFIEMDQSTWLQAYFAIGGTGLTLDTAERQGFLMAVRKIEHNRKTADQSPRDMSSHELQLHMKQAVISMNRGEYVSIQQIEQEDREEAERESKLQSIRTKVAERVAHIQSHPLIDDLETEITLAAYMAWQERRRRYLGSTDVCALICENYPWGSEFTVWAEKTGRAEFKKSNDQTDFGKVFEEGTARLYGIKRKVVIQKCAEEIMHPTIPYLGTNRDYFTEGNSSLARRLIEVKTVHRMSGAEWGEPGTDDVPLWIAVQAQWEMGISRLNGDVFDWCDVVVLREVANPPVYPIGFDAELFEWLVEEVDAWWQEHIITDVQPEVTGLPQDTNAVNRMFRREADAIIQATPKIDAIANDLSCLCLQEKQIAQHIALCENEIKLFMGDRTKLLTSKGDIRYRRRRGRVGYKKLIDDIGPLPTDFIETYKGDDTRNLALPRGWKKEESE